MKAGACNDVEGYKFSTLRGLINIREKKIPICEDTLFNSDQKEILNWLNTTPDPEKLLAFKKGLSHQFFRSAKNRKDGKPIISETEVL